MKVDRPIGAMNDDGLHALDEARLQALARAVLDAANRARIGVSVVYLDGDAPTYAYVGEVNGELIGYPRDELGVRPIMSMLAPDERPRLAEHWAQRKRGEDGPMRFETAAISKDGRRVEIEVATCDAELEGRPVTVTFFTDITTRKRAVEELAQSERRFRAFVESAPEGVWIFDGQRLRFVNPAAVRMLGYPDAASLLAVPPSQIVHTDDAGLLMERTRLILEQGKSFEPREYRARRVDGELITVEVSSIRIEYEGAPALLSFGRDVTERKRMEAQLVHADRLAALGTLAAGIAHEINNPLSYALLGLEQALRSLETSDGAPGVARQRVGEALHGLGRVAEIVRKLRTFSHFGSEPRQALDVRRPLEDALRIADNEMRHRATLSLELGDVPVVEASSSQLEQVFLNLLVNAVQAIGEITGTWHEIRVRTSANEAGDAVVEVSDTGSGIPAHALPKIFDPFFTTKPIGAGTGLGLSICHSIITGHGGRIEVRSAPGEGSTFRVVLPARAREPMSPRDSPQAMARESHSTETERRRSRLLVIDDEHRLSITLETLLGDEFEVSGVTSARDALDQLMRSVDWYAVLCDLMMPEMTGCDLYDLVCSDRPELRNRFVFMTGGAFTPRASQFLAEVSCPLIEKPFAAETLRAALRRVIDGS